MEIIRAFIALDIGNTVRSRLKALTGELKRADADVRWVKPENMHLTLAFLGNIETAKLRPLKDALRRNLPSLPCFDLEVHGTGVFGRRTRPSVVWAGLNESSALFQLQQRVVSAVDQAGIEYINRTFRPHLTLGRFKSLQRAEQLFPLLDKAKEQAYGTTRIHSVKTIQSELKPAGAVYTVLHSVRLAER